jgi:hypothetical protein
MGLVVGLSSRKRGQERVVDVQELTGELTAKIFIEYLHVTSEDDKVGFLLAENFSHLLVGRDFIFWGYRYMMEGDAMGFDHFAVIFVI